MKVQRFEPYRAIGTTHYGFVWISKGLFQNPEKVRVFGPSANGPWHFCEGGDVCPKQVQELARQSDQ